MATAFVSNPPPSDLQRDMPDGGWDGILRPYSPEDVERLRGSVRIRHTLAERGARRLWESLQTESYVNALGALTGNQAVQMARAGLKAIYLSGWQVAADANEAGQTYPDQSLYPADSVPTVVRGINRALQRADQIEHSEGKAARDWFLPIVADDEAGFGGPLNTFELIKAMIQAGASGIHLEDQLSIGLTDNLAEFGMTSLQAMEDHRRRRTSVGRRTAARSVSIPADNPEHSGTHRYAVRGNPTCRRG